MKQRRNTDVSIFRQSLSRNEAAIADALPRVKLQVFHGDLAEWEEWWEIFDSLVHQNRHLNDREKFSLLRSHLKDEAKAVVTYLPVNADYYGKAVELLKNKYNKPKQMNAARMRNLMELQPIANIEDYNGQSALHDQAICLAYGIGILQQRMT